MSNNQLELTTKIRGVSRYLRKEYYSNHKMEISDSLEAFGGAVTESIGPWPEFNLRGKQCKRSSKGYCTPCFYSRFPKVKGIESNEEYASSLIKQVKIILDDFEAKIINGQNAKVNLSDLDRTYINNDPVAICLTPVGSFFDNSELSQSARIEILEMLLEKATKFERDIVLYVETHVNDFISYNFSDKKNKIEIELLKALNLRIVFGFESSSNFTRNVLYNKNIKIEDFEKAVKKAYKYGFETYAFVFAGLSPLNNYDTIIDVKESLEYLKRESVKPVIMFGNVQKYTINDMLYQNGKLKLLEPSTVLDVMKFVVEEFSLNEVMSDTWLAADPIGGPPEPDVHIFGNHKKLTCDSCSKRIYNLFCKVRIDNDLHFFNQEYSDILKCKCRVSYEDLLFKEMKVHGDIHQKTERMVNYLDSHKEKYTSILKREEMLELKAGLLCYGVRCKDEITKNILANEPYSIESGFIHSTNIIVNEMSINACIDAKFTEDSPYEIVIRDNHGNLFYNQQYMCDIELLPLQSWCFDMVDDIQVGKYLRPHSKECITIWPNMDCNLDDKCKFCSLTKEKDILKPSTVIKMVKKALQYDENYEISIGGGIYKSFDENIDYYSEIVSGIRKFTSNPISLETIPPVSVNGMIKYKNSGITSMLMNLEVYDNDLRKKTCPSKSKISRDRYFEAFKEGVELFGIGQISSVLIFGIQPDEDIIEATKIMTSIGVIPIILPFQPLEGSALSEGTITKSSTYRQLSEKVNEIFKTSELNSVKVIGCTKCGACSLENIL